MVLNFQHEIDLMNLREIEYREPKFVVEHYGVNNIDALFFLSIEKEPSLVRPAEK